MLKLYNTATNVNLLGTVVPTASSLVVMVIIISTAIVQLQGRWRMILFLKTSSDKVAVGASRMVPFKWKFFKFTKTLLFMGVRFTI